MKLKTIEKFNDSVTANAYCTMVHQAVAAGAQYYASNAPAQQRDLANATLAAK